MKQGLQLLLSFWMVENVRFICSQFWFRKKA